MPVPKGLGPSKPPDRFAHSISDFPKKFEDIKLYLSIYDVDVLTNNSKLVISGQVVIP